MGLSESLTDHMTLLPGDYLFQTGDRVNRKVWMLDKGILEVFVNGVSRQILYPGDLIGKGWLATQRGDLRNVIQFKSNLDHVNSYHMATADVRAMSDCRLVSGLGNQSQIDDLRRMYPLDMKSLEHNLGQVSVLELEMTRSARDIVRSTSNASNDEEKKAF